jgi:hypothetical protein
MWNKELSDGTTVPCTTKDIDGKWGCCSQTCYEKTRKQPIPKPGYDDTDDNSQFIKGTNCPKSINCMPGPGQKDSMCSNPKKLEMCKRLGTKVYY